jgi:type IV secretory pathway VirD2 relaxase
VLGYHIIHSYKPDEVTPERAHKVGLEFAEKCFGKQYEVVVATHVDRNHIHNHITINSVSFVDGKKYRNNFKDYFHDMRGISNEVCAKHGLSVITKQDEKESMTYYEWLAKNKGRRSWCYPAN